MDNNNIQSIGKALAGTQVADELEKWLMNTVVSVPAPSSATAIELAHNNGRRALAMQLIHSMKTTETVKDNENELK